MIPAYSRNVLFMLAKSMSVEYMYLYINLSDEAMQ